MAFEGEAELGGPVGRYGLEPPLCLLLRLLLAEVLDAHAALDGPHRKALLVREDGYAPGPDRQKRNK